LLPGVAVLPNCRKPDFAGTAMPSSLKTDGDVPLEIAVGGNSPIAFK
jgi:hypothetical protein